MRRRQKGEIEWLEFDLLGEEKGVNHGVFLRHGGISEGVFFSLNVSKNVGDHPENVEKNRQMIREALALEELVSLESIHRTHIALVESPQEIYQESDGLMTSHVGWGLMALHADCQAAIFYDPIHRAVANVHAGWRGQVKQIYRITLDKMACVFGTRPEEVLVCISPSLGPDHSEFIHYQEELPTDFLLFQTKPTYFDLWAISQYQLESCGVLPHHIEIAKIDTYAHPDDFFSYRREKATGHTDPITGSHGTVVALCR